MTPEERAAVLAACNAPEHASKPPGQIVAALADEGIYLASESSFYRILRAEDQQHHRGRARKPSASRPPVTHCATAPNTVWCWDVTWLPAAVRGRFFFLYLIMDLYSRKIVGWEVHERESAVHSSELVQKTVWAEGCTGQPLVLHGDNGSVLKGQTVQVMLGKLGITASFSRPRVSDDNAYVESLFRTCKYVPHFPKQGFDDVTAARDWIHGFVDWYNHQHKHRGINYVTPHERHTGQDTAILEHRHAVYQQARERNPARWSGETRNWSPVGAVWLNPEKENQPMTQAA
ncbi:MAG: IS3 family transposase [Desulfuromonadales bacterium]|nr:IS3 family transposase [Desulfuromonadales bacterium]